MKEWDAAALLRLLSEAGMTCLARTSDTSNARQLHDQSNLPAGGFEMHFPFARVLIRTGQARGQLSAGDFAAGVVVGTVVRSFANGGGLDVGCSF